MDLSLTSREFQATGPRYIGHSEQKCGLDDAIVYEFTLSLLIIVREI